MSTDTNMDPKDKLRNGPISKVKGEAVSAVAAELNARRRRRRQRRLVRRLCTRP